MTYQNILLSIDNFYSYYFIHEFYELLFKNMNKNLKIEKTNTKGKECN